MFSLLSAEPVLGYVKRKIRENGQGREREKYIEKMRKEVERNASWLIDSSQWKIYGLCPDGTIVQATGIRRGEQSI